MDKYKIFLGLQFVTMIPAIFIMFYALIRALLVSNLIEKLANLLAGLMVGIPLILVSFYFMFLKDKYRSLKQWIELVKDVGYCNLTI